MKLPARLLIGLGAVAFVAAAAGVYVTRDRSLARVRATRELRIGYAVEAPYSFVRPDGAVAGQSADLAKYLAGRIGADNVVWRQIEFSKLFDELRANRVDVIAAGTFITPERAAVVAFSEPIFHVGPGLLVPRGNPLKITGYDDFAGTREIRVAVIAGSIERGLLLRAGLPETRIVIVPDAVTGRVAVESGSADCLALSSPTVHWMAINDQLGRTEEVAIVHHDHHGNAGLHGYGAFAFRLEDAALREAWNAELKSFVGSDDYRKMIAPYGFTEAELPGNVTTAEVLGK